MANIGYYLVQAHVDSLKTRAAAVLYASECHARSGLPLTTETENRPILIRGARQLLTLHGPSGPRRGEHLNSLGLIEDGAILIAKGVVAGVGPTRRVENLIAARDAVDFNASGHVVMPAFVDPHAHLIAGTSLIDREDAETLQRSFVEFDRPRRTAFASGQVRRTPAKTIEHRARKLLDLFARHGSLTVEAKSGYGFDESAETKLLRVLRQCDTELMSVIPTFFIPGEAYSTAATARNEYLTWMKSEFLPRLAHKRLATFVDVDCDVESNARDDAFALIEAAAAAHLMVKVHAEAPDTACVERVIRHRAASIDGLRQISPESARHIAATPTIATIIPSEVIQGGAAAPARTLIDAGVPVALASGFHHSRVTTFNMQSAISLACSHMKLTTAEAISAATINAAYASGVAARTGSLQFGKDADILVLAISDYREISYYFGVNQVHVAFKRGQPVYHHSSFQNENH